MICVVALAGVSLANAAQLPNLPPLIKQLKPVVVNISTTSIEKSGPEGLPGHAFKGNPLFEDFFKKFMDQMPKQRSHKSRSLGSGVIVGADGYILTNNHVVEDANEITVVLNDEREFDAEIVGRDAKTDLALIRIKVDGPLPVAKLGDSDKSEVGSWVVAIGNPFGLDTTVTAGIISAKGRVIGNGPYDNFIQTDAAINPGNSGGPLFNLDGEVIGINTAIFSRSGGNMGIGFAIPMNLARTVMDQLKENGHVTRGWLGVRIQTVTPTLAKGLKLEKPHGALVVSVEPEGPAAQGGIEAGDVIVKFNGGEVNKMNELPAMVANTPVGDKVPVVVIRDGDEKTLHVKIAKLDETKVADDGSPASERKTSDERLGLVLQGLTDALREQLEVPAGTVGGVLIAKVTPDSAAADAGLRAGDVIVSVDQKPAKSPDALRDVFRKLKGGDTALLYILRKGEPSFVALETPKD
ncbi:putative protease Do [Magnetofaba australis IT-1]|uniref:Probable periplasmic serine endoprotease DegP-like n=2 Tax=Magnetofaba TaxID=1472292 RepID=A0A1Y2K5A2_9PROT|nr:putative protease Do [Magnetofaba australis IT-1]